MEDGLPVSSEEPRAGEGRLAAFFLMAIELWSMAHFSKRILKGLPFEATPGEAAAFDDDLVAAPARLFIILFDFCIKLIYTYKIFWSIMEGERKIFFV